MKIDSKFKKEIIISFFLELTIITLILLIPLGIILFGRNYLYFTPGKVILIMIGASIISIFFVLFKSSLQVDEKNKNVKSFLNKLEFDDIKEIKIVYITKNSFDLIFDSKSFFGFKVSTIFYKKEEQEILKILNKFFPDIKVQRKEITKLLISGLVVLFLIIFLFMSYLSITISSNLPDLLNEIKIDIDYSRKHEEKLSVGIFTINLPNSFEKLEKNKEKDESYFEQGVVEKDSGTRVFFYLNDPPKYTMLNKILNPFKVYGVSGIDDDVSLSSVSFHHFAQLGNIGVVNLIAKDKFFGEYKKEIKITTEYYNGFFFYNNENAWIIIKENNGYELEVVISSEKEIKETAFEILKGIKIKGEI